MAEENAAAVDGRKAKLLMIGILAGAAILGGSLGSMVLGPKIVSARNPKQMEKAAEKTAKAVAAATGAETKGIVYQIENVVVNPAGQQGVHFLMVSIAFEVPDAKAEAALRANDVRVRDTVIATLEDQTMEMLTEPGARDRLKQELGEAVKPLNGGAAWMNVYLPQFVIQ